FSNGSACLLMFRCTTSDCLDDTGHVVVSRQSSYFDKYTSGSSKSPSFFSKKNSPFEGVDGQYINLEGSYVVSSKLSIPISFATILATAGYSSSETSRLNGIIKRNLGFSGVCLCVEYTQHLKS